MLSNRKPEDQRVVQMRNERVLDEIGQQADQNRRAAKLRDERNLQAAG
jgi:hypothetical protein